MSPLPSSAESEIESPTSSNCTDTSLLGSCRQTDQVGASNASPSPSQTQTQGPDNKNQNPPHGNGSVAAIVTVSGIVFLTFLGIYLFFRTRKKNSKNRNRISSGFEVGDFSRRYIPPLLQFSTDNNQTSAASTSRSHTPGLEPLLDDHALVKQFQELDGKITDHVVNYWHSGEISSRDYQAYINSESSRQSWNKILFQGRPLLVNFGARVHMFRAILAYHVYSCIADWKILTNEQQVSIVRDGTIRNSVRRKICSSLRSSEQDKMKRVEIIFNILEKETRLHVSNENRYDELHKESLENIAESVVNIGIQLGSQKDDFRFEFRNKDIDGGIRDNSLVVSLLGEPGANSETVEVVNEMGGTIRALVSPGVVRVPISKNKEEYFIRKTLVFTA